MRPMSGATVRRAQQRKQHHALLALPPGLAQPTIRSWKGLIFFSLALLMRRWLRRLGWLRVNVLNPRLTLSPSLLMIAHQRLEKYFPIVACSPTQTPAFKRWLRV
jgi:hypothetical protein